MACMKISNELWDWKTGDKTTIKIGQAVIPMNYFSCGTYFFDGEFQVVKFPKGMQLYHGSGALANANVEFPAGPDFYKPHQMDSPSQINFKELEDDLLKHPNESVEFAASKFFKISAGWFADPNVAKLYSLQNKNFSERCGEKCISVYELKNDATFIILDNNFNIWRFINDNTVPEKTKKELKFMFNLDTIEADYDQHKFGEIDIKRKQRRSYRNIDLPFTEWLCGYLTKDYAGYAANTAVEKGKSYFHLEFTFCEPMKWLKRNLKNQLDWQYNTYDKADTIIRQFLEQMSYYKSTNINFHAGDLLEHSVWSLLFAEQLLLGTKYGVPAVDIQKKIAAIAFIHDIGKMAPSKTQKRKHDCIYYSIPTHPEIGGDYIRGILQLPLLDYNMNIIGVFDIKRFLVSLGIGEQDFALVAKIIDLHWEFGSFLNKWSGYGDMKTVNAFIDRVGRNESFIFFFTLIIVSIADILASQPYGVNNLTSELNHQSRFFPFIKNVPKKYRGGNLADLTASKRNLFAEQILDTIKALNYTDVDIIMEEFSF